jgi:uncharacterized protein YjbJ (UPF0337 family)
MNKTLEGHKDKLVGRTKRAAGALTGDKSTEAKGAAQQFKGAAERAVGKVQDKADDAADRLDDEADDHE